MLRYAEGHNPNGSQDDIAGVANAHGNVMGLMPHPEHAVDVLTGGSRRRAEALRGDGAVSPSPEAARSCPASSRRSRSG